MARLFVVAFHVKFLVFSQRKRDRDKAFHFQQLWDSENNNNWFTSFIMMMFVCSIIILARFFNYFTQPI